MNKDTLNTDVQELICQYKRSMGRTKELWNRIPANRIPFAHFNIGLDSRRIGLYILFLGDTNESLKWLKEAASNYLRSRTNGQHGEVQIIMWAEMISILSKDKTLINESVDAFGTITIKTPEYFYVFAECLCNLVKGCSVDAVNSAKQLIELEPNNYSKLKYYSGLGVSCLSIAKKNKNCLLDGLRVILIRHKTLVPILGGKMDDALTCVPATALLLIAKDNGIIIKKEEIDEKFRDYIPWILLEDE